MNPVLEIRAILSLQGSKITEQAAIGQVLERIEDLNLNVSDIRQQMRKEANARGRYRCYCIEE
jgi:hypothetical protein